MYQDIKCVFKRCGWLLFPFLILLYNSTTILQTYLMAIFSLLVFLFVPWKKYLSNEFIALLFFSFFYCLGLWTNGIFRFGTATIFYLLGPIMFYCFGRYIVDRLKNSYLIVVFLLALTFLFSLNLYISILLDIQENGFINIFRQVKVLGLVIKSNKSGALAATLLGVNASLGFVGLSIFIYCKKYLNNLIRYLFLILSLLSLVTVVHLINRTGIVLLVCSFFAVTLYSMRRSFWRVLGVLTIGFIVVYFVYSFGWMSEDILHAYKNRDVEGHSVAEGGGRIGRWIDALVYLVKYPWGFSQMKGVHHAHNLWLDVGRVAGFLPLIALLFSTIFYLFNFLKLLRRKVSFLVSIFISYNVVFFITCMVEPIMEGFSLYFFLYVMFWGMQDQYLKQLKYKQISI